MGSQKTPRAHPKVKLVWTFKADDREQNTMEDTELDGGREKRKGRPR